MLMKLELNTAMIPKGNYKPGKPDEDIIRPKSIKGYVDMDKEQERVVFSLNKKYHVGRKKNK